ncbi:tetratricopeptide repeat protein [Niveispirillum sp.]|uniref:tetratricopeptide repeat protein n=1 Tax=Niveispirillum sp. TaxID=1917217 RepID=UPI001B72F51B|nr:tetratricopeptide repeat protein [Niveispirillum sp.]MBP7337444.1 tetratricopeptide repeat protein [Niveispirillum sp.]
MIRRLPTLCLALSLLVLLPGCLTPRWAQPVNPFMNDDTDRGRAALKAKDYVMALEFYGRLAEQDPNDMGVRYQLALIKQQIGRYDEAYGLFRVVYVSADEDTAPRLDGSESEEPLYLAAERNLRLLGARLDKSDPDLTRIQEERARKLAEMKAAEEAGRKQHQDQPTATGTYGDGKVPCSVTTLRVC